MASSHFVRVGFILFLTSVEDMSILLTMNATDYEAVLTDTLQKMASAQSKKEQLEIEVANLRQFFLATLNMLPGDKRDEYMAAFRVANEDLKLFGKLA